MVSEQCVEFESEAVPFVLGDIPAETRAQMLVHLESCPTCRREVSTLAEALDSISAAVVPLAPSAGFVERVLAAAGPAVDVTHAGASAPAPLPPSPRAATASASAPAVTAVVEGGAVRRPVAVVMRRRRTLLSLTAATAALSLMAVGLNSWTLIALAVASAVLEVSYLALVIRVTHTKARFDMASAFGRPERDDDRSWSDLGRDLRMWPMGEEADGAPVISVGNTALARFVLAYFVGWILTPVVAVISLVRGDLTGIEGSPVLSRIVDLQRRGRSQSLKLLVAGATTVAVAGGGTVATVLVAPGMAAAATSTASYTVHPGDTLWGIAESRGVSASYLAQLNGIADPSEILPGEVIRLAGPAEGADSAPSATYTVRPGDTLDAIAARFGTTEQEMAALNRLSDPNLILVGQVLRLPSSAVMSATVTAQRHAVEAGAGSPSQTPPTSYRVRPGDTLDAIAARFGTTAAHLAALNGIADPNVIEVGRLLRLQGPPVPPATPPAEAPSASRTAAPEPVQAVAAPVPSQYVNPFRFGSWSPARIDEGVDWIPNVASPVVAIGDGVITYSSMSSGWPGGGFITYRLTSGSHAGLYVYVAEHITGLLPAGTVVRAGQQIATALPGYPWTEWGWASPGGPEPAPSAQYNGAPDGTATPGGQAFARFLISIGVTGVPDPGPGPTTP